MMFVDNAGADVVLGMLPLAREMLRLGAEVSAAVHPNHHKSVVLRMALHIAMPAGLTDTLARLCTLSVCLWHAGGTGG